MSRTKALQQIINTRMSALKYGNNISVNTYADEAPDGAIVPYVTYNINSFSYEDIKDTIVLECDVWDLGINYQRAEEIADNLETLFNDYAPHSNSAEVLPHFFRYIRSKVPDTDKKVKRISVKFEIQNYAHSNHN